MQLSGHEIIVLLSVFLGGGVAVSLFSQAIKKIFGLQSAQVIHTMVVAISVAAAGAQYLLSLKNLPPSVLGISTTAIYGFSQLIFKYSKQASSFLTEVQNVRSDKAAVAKVQANAAVAAVVAPGDVTGTNVANF